MKMVWWCVSSMLFLHFAHFIAQTAGDYGVQKTTYHGITEYFKIDGYGFNVGEQTALPFQTDVGEFRFKRTGDEKFKSGEIIVWENKAGTNGAKHQNKIGFSSSIFSNSLVKVELYVKFIDTIPDKSEGDYGLYLYTVGKYYTNVTEDCQPNVWCRIAVAEKLSSCSPCSLEFWTYKIKQKQKIEFARFSVTYLKGEIYPLVVAPYTLHPSRGILCSYTASTLPQNNGPTTVDFPDVQDDVYSRGEIISYNKPSGTSVCLWVGFKAAVFGSKILAVRFSIKFLNTVPGGGPKSGLRIFGVMYTNWISTCTVGVWCDVVVRVNKNNADGDNYHLIFIFDTFVNPLKFYLTEFSVTIIPETPACTRPQRGRMEVNAPSFTYNGEGKYTYEGCSQTCNSQGYRQMTWYFESDLITTGRCGCTNGAGTQLAENAIYCHLNDHNTNKLDGQWGLWSPWTSCRHIRKRGWHKKRSRVCATFPPSLNAGSDHCPGGSIDYEPCFSSAVIASGYDLARGSVTPTTVVSFYTELGFAHHTWNDLKIQFWSKASVTNGRTDLLYNTTSFPGSRSYISTSYFQQSVDHSLKHHDMPNGMVTPKSKVSVTSMKYLFSASLPFHITYKMADNPTSWPPKFVTNMFWISDGFDYERIYVEQSMIPRTPPSSSLRSRVSFSYNLPPKSLILPSGKLIVNLRLSTTTMVSPTSLQVTIHLPLFIDTSQVSWELPYGNGEFDDNKRVILWQLPYLEPALTYGLNGTLVLPILVDESTLRNNKFILKIPVTITHCRRYCETDENLHYISEFFMKFYDIYGGNQVKMDFAGAKRIRYKNIAYVNYDSTNNRLITTTQKFKDNFYSDKGKLYYKGISSSVNYFANSSSAYYHQNTFIGKSSRNDTNITVGFYKNYPFAYDQTSMKVSCISENSSLILANMGEWNIANLDSCASTNFKLLPGLDTSDNLVYRGLLKITTAIGDVIIVINPTSDLSKSYNCFYTSDVGNSWKGVSSLVTNIDFYIATTDYLYGRCNGGKLYYCKFLFNDVYQSGSDKANFLTVSPSEYNTAQTSVEAVLIYIVDDIRFSNNDPIQSSIDDTLGVSFHGVHKDNAGQWEVIFVWGD